MASALTSTRRAQIMTRAREYGRVDIGDLANIWRVSHETIRRDLKVLEDDGVLMRVHGGAVLPNLISYQPADNGFEFNQKVKEKIADLALDLVANEMALFLDHTIASITLSQKLNAFQNLTIVTNSLEVAKRAGNHASNRVIVTGGIYHAKESCLLGFETVTHAKQYHYDVAFNGIAGLSLNHGLMDFQQEEAELRQALIENTRRFVVLASSVRFEQTAFVRSLNFEQMDDLVTEVPPPDDFTRKLKQVNVGLHLPATNDELA